MKLHGEMKSATRVLYRSYQSIRFRQPNTLVESSRPYRCAAEDDPGHPSISQWHTGVGAALRMYFDWFPVEQVLRQGCVLASLLFNIIAVIIHVTFTHFYRSKMSWTRWWGSEGNQSWSWRGLAKA